jgi:hypothetical protein
LTQSAKILVIIMETKQNNEDDTQREINKRGFRREIS